MHRAKFISLAIAATLLLTFIVGLQWVNKPVRTARQFHRFLEQGRNNEAKEMLAETAGIEVTTDGYVEISVGGLLRRAARMPSYKEAELVLLPRSFWDLLAGRCKFEITVLGLGLPFEVANGEIKPLLGDAAGL